ncbi:putative DNA primase/helicase [Rhizomicrobium palustre]|uniref:Putative DNA primase/helicase n=1 Tax=Rhizomicrobium palustre TaxID=189966 RepID=A0A846MW41_9PROT|nr:phage/plasmid primase, P4 family [Rhizomicrobium palustre]NIK87606.1 putative DNA primase/helicase [Rhizomicrobium palustre]
MADFHDPYDDELEPVTLRGTKRRARNLEMLEAPTEGDDLNRICALQPMNDFGNAQRLVLRFGDSLMFVENIGWFAWDGSRWDREGGHSGALKFSFRIGQEITAEAKALRERPGRVSAERIDRLFSWSVQSGNYGRAQAMLSSASSFLSQPVDALDAHTFLIAAPNGTIELSSHCELRESRREDRITRCLGVKFSTKASCPLFKKFLARIIPDEEMRDFVQRIFGYCLTGSTREHKLFLFYGTGRNGKSTLINIIRSVMGDYAMGAPVATFLAKREGSSGGEASPDLARLPGARMVTTAEPPEGGRLDESKVKEITGGDSMTVRHLNQGFFEFTPTFKAIIATNHRPTIRGTDHGIWSRINLIPFTVQIPEDEIDRDLERKLAEEREGILQWMLTGAEDWFSGGLRPPEKAIAAVEAYRADEDPVGEFLKARIQLTGDDVDPCTGRRFEVSAKDLRMRYKTWCEEEGLDALPTKAFGSRLVARGLERRKTNGLTWYVGMMFNARA